jgi:hypothetical protein
MIVTIEDNTIANHLHIDHKRRKNWVAIVERDMSQPGGLRRSFLDRAPGGRVFTKGIQVGCWLEFASDYYTGGGSKRPGREYFRVREMTTEGLSLETCDKEDVGKPSDDITHIRPMTPRVIDLAKPKGNNIVEFQNNQGETLATVCVTGYIASTIVSEGFQLKLHTPDGVEIHDYTGD